jgi:DNA-binding transcriptional LysR family regulator
VCIPRQVAPRLYDAILGACAAAGFSPRIAQEAIQMQTIVNLVSAGLGLALVPQSMRLLQRPGIVYRDLPASLDAAPRCETSLIWSQGAPPVVRRFVEFVRAGR